MGTPTIDELAALVRHTGDDLLGGVFDQQVQVKQPHDFVTAVDHAVQAALHQALSRRWPEIQFMGEEQDNSHIDPSKPYWALDPVDGTTNLIHNFQHSVISLALVAQREPWLAVVYDPYRKELFTAQKGGGAFLNGRPISVSAVEHLSGALVFVGTAPYRVWEAEERFMRIMRVYQASHDVRRFGCTALELCYLACGRADGCFEYGTKPWDIAAGWLILKEAGGEIRSIAGGLPPLDRESEIVATNGKFTEELSHIL